MCDHKWETRDGFLECSKCYCKGHNLQGPTIQFACVVCGAPAIALEYPPRKVDGQRGKFKEWHCKLHRVHAPHVVRS